MNIFIDTSAWIALENKRDIHFKEAITFKEEIRNKSYRLYTSNFVLDETYTLLLANVGYEKTIEFAKRIRGLRDKFWSFTDCTSKAIMELLDIKEGFTFDKDFEQMGFVKRP